MKKCKYTGTKFKVKDHIEHQNIGGKEIIIEFELENNEIFVQSISGNWACRNFRERRTDFNNEFSHKLYYGKVGGLGYVVAEDELEEGNSNE